MPYTPAQRAQFCLNAAEVIRRIIFAGQPALDFDPETDEPFWTKGNFDLAVAKAESERRGVAEVRALIADADPSRAQEYLATLGQLRKENGYALDEARRWSPERDRFWLKPVIGSLLGCLGQRPYGSDGPMYVEVLMSIADHLCDDAEWFQAREREMSVATAQVQTAPESPAGPAQATELPLMVLAKQLRLRGNQLKLVEMIAAAAGPIPLADVGLELGWIDPKVGVWSPLNGNDWSSLRGELNDKLKDHGWKIRRSNGCAEAVRTQPIVEK